MPEETIEQILKRDSSRKARGAFASAKVRRAKKAPKKVRTDEDRKRNREAVARYNARKKGFYNGLTHEFEVSSKMGHTPIPEGYKPFPLANKLAMEKGLEEVCAIVLPVLKQQRADWKEFLEADKFKQSLQ